MGIQIKGSNDTISAADGSIVLEGATLTFTNENISGISTMASAEVTGNLSIADTIVHTGDTNTKIRFSDADTISFETGGSARAFINSAGDLTIGGSAGTLGKLYIKQAADTDSEGVTLLNSGGSNSFRMYLGDSSGAVGHIGHGGQKQLNITQAGLVGVGTAAPDGLLTIKGDSDQVSTPSIRLLDGSDTREVSISNTSGDFVASVHGNDNAIHGHIKMFESGIFDINNGGSSGSNTLRLRITSAGEVLIGGHSSAIQPDSYASHLEVHGTDTSAGISILRYSANSAGPTLLFGKSRGASIGSIGEVQTGDSLGKIEFYGTDTGWESSASVRASADGEWYSGSAGSEDNTDAPGRLEFHTTPDGSDNLSERLRITSGGNVNIGGNYTQTNAPLSVTTNANDYGYRLMTGSNVVMELLNNDSAGNCEMRGYYNNNSGTRAEGFRIEANGATFFNPGGNTGVTIDANGKFCAGGTTVTTAPINVNTQAHYVVTSSGRSTNGIHIRGNGGNSGEYGGGISFGCNGDGAAAIAAEQMSSDVDVIGLSFFTRSTSTGSDDATKTVRFPSNGGIELHNWANSKGLIFRSDSTVPAGAMVQSSVGRGICSGKIDSIAQNTATTLGNSHWGGLALVGYEGTGHQGYRLVAYGYGGAGVSVLFSGQWVGSLTTTFTMNTYSLQVSHNSSNNLNFWLINLGV